MKFSCCQQVREDRKEGESRDLQIVLQKEKKKKKRII
jgi:hypothetical protein